MYRILFLILFSLLFTNGIYSQSSSCPNLDFETGTLANWSGSTGYCCPINIVSAGFAFNRHTIMSGTGYDPHSLNQIPVVAPGGGHYSVRLGNDNVNSEAEMLQYTVSVSPQSDLFIYRYAVVLEDPAHAPPDQPRFEIRVYDQAGQNIQCGIYNVVASANIPGFQNNGDVRFKPWTTVGIDLSSYIGQNVIVEFRTGDCALGAHYGYAYIDCSCGPLQIQNAYCPNSVDVTLQAPEGFASYIWSTGATTSFIVVPTANVGTVYSCTLTSVTGCSFTLSTSIASTSISAAFTLLNNCQNTVVFSDQSTAFNGTPSHWHWEFGDSTTSTSQNPVHIYNTPGTYSIQLITESDMGCIDTVTNQALIWPSPNAFVSVQNACEGLPSQFYDSVTIAWGTISSWHWSFSDGSVSSLASPNHLFYGTGNYSAELIVTSDLGCVDTTTINFNINPIPVIEAGPDISFCGGSIVNLGDPNNPPLDYQWSPVIGVINAHSQMTTVNIPDPVQSSEYYYYYLTGRDPVSGCNSKDSVLIEAKAYPIASFVTPSAECFRGNSFDLAANPTFAGSMYQWFFGPSAQPGNLISPVANGIHFSQPGEFPLLLVVNNNGCIDSATGLLKVVEEPVIQLSIAKEGCVPLAVNFESIVTPAGPLDYLWSFSDNTVSTEEKPVHTFTEPGTYSLSLNVTDPYGCTDYSFLYNVIKVLPRPEADFATEPDVASIVDPHFSFLNFSKDGYLLKWDFGDDSFSYDFNTAHTYQDTGLYFVRLIMSNSFGCNDTSISPVRVEPYFSFYVPNVFTPNGDGVNDSFRGLGMYIKNYEMRIYNRWGRMIYFTSDYDSPWDGKGDYDNVAQNDVYEYLIKITDTNEKDHQYTGHVSLVR